MSSPLKAILELVLIGGFVFSLVWLIDRIDVQTVNPLMALREAAQNLISYYLPKERAKEEIFTAQEADEENESFSEEKNNLDEENEEREKPTLQTPSKLTLEDIQEKLDDISEKVDVLTQEVDKLTVINDSNFEQTSEELAKVPENEEQKEDEVKKDKEETEEKIEEKEEQKELAEPEENELKQEVEQDFCKKIEGSPVFRNKVILNEIAWMGTENSSNDEWIELKNISKEAVNLSGWQLLDKENQIKIVFEETIAPAGFLILERTNDDTLKTITADKIYSGSLNDEDEYLYLFNLNCQLEDEVLADKDWLAGDKNSKRTMERKSDLGWQTSAQIGGTPKVENSSGFFEGSGSGGGGAVIPVSYPKILISEIQIASKESEKDEFLELYNPNNSDVDLTDWYLQRKTKTAKDYSSFVSSSLLTGKIIKAQDYFLIAREGSTFANLADVLTSYPIGENNTLILKNPNREIVDKVGFGEVQESETSPAPNPAEDQSIERKKDNLGVFIDSGNNYQDFFLQQNPNPKGQILDSSSPQTPVITFPQNNQLFNLNPVIIKGVSESQVQILIESELGNFEVFTDKDGIFEKDLSLQEGLNQIKIKAKDQAGNESEQTIINLILDTQPPLVNFESLPELQTNIYFVLSWSGSDGAATPSTDGVIDFLLQYTTTPSDIDGIRLQYQNEQDAWESWQAESILETKLTSLNLQGEDKYTYNFKIKARDQAGNESDWQYFSARISLLEPILITEVQIEGLNVNQDFVELYNPNNSDINLDDYQGSYLRLVKRTKTAASDTTIKSWSRDSEAKILSHGYYLWVSSKDESYPQLINADVSTKEILAPNNGIALRIGPEDTGLIIEAFGWGDFQNVLFESTSFPQNPGLNESLGRKWEDNNQKYEDTNNNLEDFQIQNSSPKEKNG